MSNVKLKCSENIKDTSMNSNMQQYGKERSNDLTIWEWDKI